METYLLDNWKNPGLTAIIFIGSDDKIDLLRMYIRLEFSAQAVVKVSRGFGNHALTEQGIRSHGEDCICML